MFNQQQKQVLLTLASDSIKYGLENKQALAIKASDFNSELQQHLACFVTLHLAGQLRGCIGSLEAYRPLVNDVVNNAFAAAFSDYRFSPVSTSELSQLTIDISVLTPAKEMVFTSEADLLQQIRPEIDGLILQEGNHRATFLPSVWSQLPNKQNFLNHLKQKAGLAADYWSTTIQISRYQTEFIE
ncbi:MAG: AmmeMemoRadiSam system protein A [Gammaproteobacteria bacterium]|nr:AmmeMemoRadiSam system protein A [Gammaproteobacteria bacterium]